MKLKGLALLGLISALLLSPLPTSFAEPTPQPSSSATPDFDTLMEQYKLNLEKYRVMQNPTADSQLASTQYKSSLDMFKVIQSMREDLRVQINRTFMASVEKTNKDARTAMKSAKSAAAKNDVITKQKIAITAASYIRDSALTELGAMPLQPIKPLKQNELQPVKKGKKSSPAPSRESDH